MRRLAQGIMGAERTGYYILGFSVFSIVIAAALLRVGSFQIDEIDVEEEAIFTGRNGNVPVVEYGTYSVFVVSDYSCDDVEVSIYVEDEEDEEYVWEYFFRDCDEYLNEKGWNYVGYFSSDFEGSMNVEANRQILIIDDIVYFNEGAGTMLLSFPFCCLGVIGLIIAVSILLTARSKDVNIQNTSVDFQNTPNVVFIEPTSPPTENGQDDVDEKSEWWNTGPKPE